MAHEFIKEITTTVTTKPATISVGDTALIIANAKSSTATIGHVNVYANNLLIGTLTSYPDTLQFVPTEKGNYSITAIATTTEGKCRASTARILKVNASRAPYKSLIAIPGTIEAENFDKGGEGMTFHDSDNERQDDALCLEVPPAFLLN